MKKYNAFTLAEVLITLAIIGVVAAITIPTTMNNGRKLEYGAQFRKAYNTIFQAYNLTKFEMGGHPQCFYWSPGSKEKWASYASRTAKVTTVIDPETNAISYDLKDGEGNPITWNDIKDLNGNMTECNEYFDIFIKKLKVIGICNKERIEGNKNNCIPFYKGHEGILAEQMARDENDEKFNELKAAGKSEAELKAYALTKVAGTGLKEATINKSNAYFLPDGSILLKLTSCIFVVDINGQKGPNKWGHDVFAFYLIGDPTGKTNKFKCYNGTAMVENPNSNGGGVECDKMFKSL